MRMKLAIWRAITGWLLPPKISELISKALTFSFSRTDKVVKREDLWEPYKGEEWSLLVMALKDASSYLEFGCGLSTEFVSNSYECRVRSVDTSADWVAKIQAKVNEDVEILYINLGPVGRWGRPVSYDYHEQFARYFDAGFDGGFSPDAILVDGRFRVACFLTSLLRASPGTMIVFDDFPTRPHYRIVEEILKPEIVSSRQALFVRPDSIDVSRVEALRERFTHVMD